MPKQRRGAKDICSKSPYSHADLYFFGVMMDWRTKLLNPVPRARQDYHSLVTPVYRGSTVVFDNQNAVTDDWCQAENGYSYGLYGTPTSLELAARIASIEGAKETFIVPGGQAAIALIYLGYCQAGSHALVPFSAPALKC